MATDPEAKPAGLDAGDADDDPLYPIRCLEPGDNDKGFVDLLNQLSPSPPVPDSDFRSRLAELSALGGDHLVLVTEDPRAGRVVAAGTVFVERKFLRGCSKVGHIEDVVVDASARGRHLGQRIVRRLIDHAHAAGCYKVILDCTPELRAYYEKCGFIQKNIQMALYFNH